MLFEEGEGEGEGGEEERLPDQRDGEALVEFEEGVVLPVVGDHLERVEEHHRPALVVQLQVLPNSNQVYLMVSSGCSTASASTAPALSLETSSSERSSVCPCRSEE